MKKIKIAIPDKKGFYSVTEVEDFEFVNPIEKMRTIIMSASIDMDREYLLMSMAHDKNFPSIEGVENPEEIIMRVAVSNALSYWDKKYQHIKSSKFPEEIFGILEGASKRKQKKILKGISLTGDGLFAFIFEAWIRHGFSFSSYTSSHNQKGLDVTKMPQLAYQEDNNSITTVGTTTLSTGQIKQAIQHRHVVVARFLDKGEIWHCFFFTYKSVRGEEKAWKDGTPHLHFISHTWGLSREYVLNQLKSTEYNLGSLPHIDFVVRNPQ